MTERKYQRCNRCIMDTTDPNIEFDERGWCNHCRHHDERARNELLPYEERDHRLQRLAEEIRRTGENKPHDCLIGLSGGVDSTTVAYHVRRLGLRPLAFHLDNGWGSECAVKNIENICTRLDIDLVTHVIDWEEFRDLQLAYFQASVPNIEAVSDHAINALVFHVAAKYGIKYYISGANLATEGIMPDAWGYDCRDWKNIRAIHKRFGRLPIPTYPHCSLLDFFYYLFVCRIKYIPLLNYVDYVKEDAKSMIKRELAWEDYGTKHYESIFTRFYQAYILPVKFGYDKRLAHLSVLICSGQITREEALEELRKPLYTEDKFREDIEYFLEKIALTRLEFADIMNLPVRSHEEFPSNAWFFRRSKYLINNIIKKVVKPSGLR